MKFLAQVLIGFGVGGALVPILASPLQRMLLDLCGTEERAHFWARYTWTLLFLAPLLFALLSSGGPDGNQLGGDSLQATLKSALIGALAALVAVGLMIARVMREQPALRRMAPSSTTTLGNPPDQPWSASAAPKQG